MAGRQARPLPTWPGWGSSLTSCSGRFLVRAFTVLASARSLLMRMPRSRLSFVPGPSARRRTRSACLMSYGAPPALIGSHLTSSTVLALAPLTTSLGIVLFLSFNALTTSAIPAWSRLTYRDGWCRLGRFIIPPRGWTRAPFVLVVPLPPLDRQFDGWPPRLAAS